jgi:diguanylate cyclase (GGDEF)-like protein
MTRVVDGRGGWAQVQVTQRVGVLSPFVGGDYYGALIAGVNDAATAAGFGIIAIQTLDPGSHSADYSGVPDFRHPIAWDHVDGLIVLPGAVDTGYLLRAQAAGKFVVLIGHQLPGVECPQVFADNRSGVREAVAHLVEQHGHDRIAFAGNLAVSDIAERYEGYREALAAHGLPDRPELLFISPDNHETGGAVVADQLVQAGLPSTAMVIGTDRNAIGLIQRLAAAAYELPAELAVVGFDDIADTRFVVPSLASVYQPLDQLGALAFTLFAALLAGEDVPAGPRYVPTTFVQRDSCGCPSAGLQLSETQARHQFDDNAYLQMTLNIQYELAVELLRTHEQDPRELAWLGRTPALGGCLGMWTTGVALAPTPAGPENRPDPRLDLVGTFRAAFDPPVRTGETMPVSEFPPPGFFTLADGTVGDVVFVVPVRTQAHDWGVLSAVGRIQATTPPGREMMNHSGALLGVALDHDTMLRSLMEQEERLRRAALYDQLTGLPNRALLFDRLNQAGHRAARHPGHHFALLFLDLDGFKSVNDTLGHAAGDKLLVHVAKRLNDAIRDADTAARLGGDEFVVLLDGISPPNGPEPVIERIHHSLAEPIVIDGHSMTVSTSIGLALSTEGFADAEDLLKHADEAMYAAKMARKARPPEPVASEPA